MAGMSDTAQKRDVLEALRSLLAHRTEDLGCYEFVLEAWIESAADEIERLRAENKRLWQAVSDMKAAAEAAGLVFRNTDSGPNLVAWTPPPEPPEVK
jgi:hypothetical protein